jgi:hypothetical protein
MTTGRINQVALSAHRLCNARSNEYRITRKSRKTFECILVRAVNCVTARFEICPKSNVCNAIAQRIAHHKLPMSLGLHRTVPL